MSYVRIPATNLAFEALTHTASLSCIEHQMQGSLLGMTYAYGVHRVGARFCTGSGAFTILSSAWETYTFTILYVRKAHSPHNFYPSSLRTD
jgi:hypothetical protein